MKLGDDCVGAMGSEARMKYGVFGEPVETACRLEERNKYTRTSILICSNTHQVAKGPCEAGGIVFVKHVDECVTSCASTKESVQGQEQHSSRSGARNTLNQTQNTSVQPLVVDTFAASCVYSVLQGATNRDSC